MIAKNWPVAMNLIVVRLCERCTDQDLLVGALEQLPRVQEWAVLNTPEFFEVYAVCTPVEWRAMSQMQIERSCHCNTYSEHDRFTLIRDDAIINFFRTANFFGERAFLNCRRRLHCSNSFLTSLLNFVSEEALNGCHHEVTNGLEFSQFDRFIEQKQREQYCRLVTLVAEHWDTIRKRCVERATKTSVDTDALVGIDRFSREFLVTIVSYLADGLVSLAPDSDLHNCLRAVLMPQAAHKPQEVASGKF